jgi:hypothetical protein
MPRWCFIRPGIFDEMMPLKIRYHAFFSVGHSRGGLVLGKHIGWFTCPLLVGVGLAHHVLARSFFNQRICSVTKGTAGNYSLLAPLSFCYVFFVGIAERAKMLRAYEVRPLANKLSTA